MGAFSESLHCVAPDSRLWQIGCLKDRGEVEKCRGIIGSNEEDKLAGYKIHFSRIYFLYFSLTLSAKTFTEEFELRARAVVNVVA